MPDNADDPLLEQEKAKLSPHLDKRILIFFIVQQYRSPLSEIHLLRERTPFVYIFRTLQIFSLGPVTAHTDSLLYSILWQHSRIFSFVLILRKIFFWLLKTQNCAGSQIRMKEIGNRCFQGEARETEEQRRKNTQIRFLFPPGL